MKIKNDIKSLSINKKNILAISFMLAASFSFACATILVKGVGKSVFGDGIHPFQIAYSRFFFSFIFLIIICVFFNILTQQLDCGC